MGIMSCVTTLRLELGIRTAESLPAAHYTTAEDIADKAASTEKVIWLYSTASTQWVSHFLQDVPTVTRDSL